ncbi:MAG: class I SAM-dependent methyltransferase [Candidatus Lokiarchaeota archaeon]|nr:class I SAM-dependent methyltransferase [Candidatus Lokiarchaeota archaeon]
MNQNEKMSDFHFKMMSFLFRIRDFFNKPKKFLENNIPITKGSIVLDYGCGSGSYTIPLAEIVGNTGIVFAADIQPLAIKQIKRKSKQYNLSNIRPILMSGYHTGIQEGSVDAIIFFDTYHFIKDKEALFDEFKNILNSDGKIYMDSGHLKRQEALEFLHTLNDFIVQNETGKKIILKKMGFKF